MHTYIYMGFLIYIRRIVSQRNAFQSRKPLLIGKSMGKKRLISARIALNLTQLGMPSFPTVGSPLKQGPKTSITGQG